MLLSSVYTFKTILGFPRVIGAFLIQMVLILTPQKNPNYFVSLLILDIRTQFVFKDYYSKNLLTDKTEFVVQVTFKLTNLKIDFDLTALNLRGAT